MSAQPVGQEFLGSDAAGEGAVRRFPSHANQDKRGARPYSISILGTRGIPSKHGGFETFCQDLALYLVDRGHAVTVYCQGEAEKGGHAIFEDVWQGVRRVFVPVSGGGPMATVKFDIRCTFHAMRERGPTLLLGYNTAVFSSLLRLTKRPLLLNMDGIEWRRPKWSKAQRLWLLLNERIGGMIGNTLIADHPEIKRHLATFRNKRSIVTIPYGADDMRDVSALPLKPYGFEPGRYVVAIGRLEPENSIVELVKAYARKPRSYKLICLGQLNSDRAYHQEIIKEASDGVIFPGPIYDRNVVASLRRHAMAYCHGHTVGGTNPSLVESLATGCPVIAHDNPYNRWVAGEGQAYFTDTDTLAAALDRLDEDTQWRSEASLAAHARFKEAFTQDQVLGAYEKLLNCWS